MLFPYTRLNDFVHEDRLGIFNKILLLISLVFLYLYGIPICTPDLQHSLNYSYYVPEHLQDS